MRVLEELFPETRLLLCHFHVLKWMKKIISSAPVVMSLRSQIYDSFKKLLYAYDAEEFETRYKEWTKLIEGVLVKTNSSRNSQYVSLHDYFEDNWVRSCKEMWVMYKRKNLPISAENTTNRVERSFGLIKYVLNMNNRKSISIESAVIQVVQWAESKLVSGNVNSMRTEMSIYDEDPELRQMYTTAAGVLNRSGCLALKKSIELYKKCERKMSMSESGVSESSSLSGSAGELRKNYQTTDRSCDCSYWRKNQHVCKHIVYLRKSQNLPLFTPECFADYYLKVILSDEVLLPENSQPKHAGGPSQSEIDSSADSGEESPDTFAFSHNEKFRISQDSLAEVTELLPRFGTKEFSRYMWEVEILKKRIRRGEPIFELHEESDGKETITPNTDKSVEKKTDTLSELGNEVNRLKFEKSLKKKGRPKKKRGRVSFNRSKVDVKSSPVHVSQAESSPVQVDKSNHNSFISAKPEPCIPNSRKEQKPSFSRFDHICCHPSLPGQIGDNTITFHDYASLVVGKYVTDSIVNWSLRLLSLKCQNSDVEILSTEFYMRLENWGTSVIDERLNAWAENFDIKTRMVVLPVCWQRHFYVLVAVLDPHVPTVFILESLGGSKFGREPPFTDKFCSLLAFSLSSRDVALGEFRKVLLDVPRQPYGSNNCGLFCIYFVELILGDPVIFVTLANSNDLAKWFPSNFLNSKRDEVAANIASAAESQRLPGGPMLRFHIDLPLPSPRAVSLQVLFLKLKSML